MRSNLSHEPKESDVVLLPPAFHRRQLMLQITVCEPNIETDVCSATTTLSRDLDTADVFADCTSSAVACEIDPDSFEMRIVHVNSRRNSGPIRIHGVFPLGGDSVSEKTVRSDVSAVYHKLRPCIC